MAFSKSGLVSTLIKQATSTSSKSVTPKSFIPSKKPTGVSNSRVICYSLSSSSSTSTFSDIMYYSKAYFTDLLWAIRA